MTQKVLVTGAGGFIGSHLVHYLKECGCWVRGVDIKRPMWSPSGADEFYLLDLRVCSNALISMLGIEQVYALAAEAGGMGFMSGQYDLEIVRNNILINLNTLKASQVVGDVERYLFTSSACVYNELQQADIDVKPLREEDVYPAQPDTEYGWEKLFTEHLCALYGRFTGIKMRIARFHNIFGTEQTWRGGREKLPAAACRKVAMAKLTGNSRVEVWGDGLATRSFCYIDDCLEMLYRLMQSDYDQPINIGTDRLVSVNEIYDIVASIADIEIEKIHISGPQGVRGRNADLTRMREVLDYEPQMPLEMGLARMYQWIEEQVRCQMSRS